MGETVTKNLSSEKLLHVFWSQVFTSVLLSLVSDHEMRRQGLQADLQKRKLRWMANDLRKRVSVYVCIFNTLQHMNSCCCSIFNHFAVIHLHKLNYSELFQVNKNTKVTWPSLLRYDSCFLNKTLLRIPTLWTNESAWTRFVQWHCVKYRNYPPLNTDRALYNSVPASDC